MLKVEAVSFLDWSPVTLELSAGEVVSVTGNSGSGKSLLLRAIADLIPNQGECRLSGEARSATPPYRWRQQVGYLAAEALWWEDLVGAHFREIPSKERLSALLLPGDVMQWDTKRLSMGERQRLGILRLLAGKPKALLLDEPTSNLDEESAAKVEAFLLEYIRENEASSIWVTHDREQAERVGARSFAMKEKRLQEGAS